MKLKNSILKLLFFLLVLGITGATTTYAQGSKEEKKNEKAVAIKNLLDSKNFVFKAQTVTPLRGSARQLTSDYDMRVSKDTIITYLPYFGRAYTAPIDPSEGGIQFTSTNFNYTIQERKRGGWDILIQPNDARDIRQVTLSVSEGGYASLQVASNNRDPISFNGYITARSQNGKR